MQENLNKRFTDRKATVKEAQVEQEVRNEIQQVFTPQDGVERIFFPSRPQDVPDRPALTLAIADPKHAGQDPGLLERIVREAGSSARTFKSGVLWVVPDSTAKSL